VREATTAAEAARITVVLVAETSALEAIIAWGSTALAKREALERVSSVEAENAVALASGREDAEGLVRKIARLEGKLVVEYRA
jgi:hypothetical protein